MDEKVEAYINKQKRPLKGILLKLREIILNTCPGIKEELWAGAPFYGRKFYIAAINDKVHLGICIKGMSKEGLRLLEGSGKTMRHIKFFALKDIDEKKIVKLLKLVK